MENTNDIQKAIRFIEAGNFIVLHDFMRYSKQEVLNLLQDNATYCGLETIQYYVPVYDRMLLVFDIPQPEGIRERLPSANEYPIDHYILCKLPDINDCNIASARSLTPSDDMRVIEYHFRRYLLPFGMGYYWAANS